MHDGGQGSAQAGGVEANPAPKTQFDKMSKCLFHVRWGAQLLPWAASTAWHSAAAAADPQLWRDSVERFVCRVQARESGRNGQGLGIRAHRVGRDTLMLHLHSPLLRHALLHCCSVAPAMRSPPHPWWRRHAYTHTHAPRMHPQALTHAHTQQERSTRMHASRSQHLACPPTWWLQPGKDDGAAASCAAILRSLLRPPPAATAAAAAHLQPLIGGLRVQRRW